MIHADQKNHTIKNHYITNNLNKNLKILKIVWYHDQRRTFHYSNLKTTCRLIEKRFFYETHVFRALFSTHTKYMKTMTISDQK